MTVKSELAAQGVAQVLVTLQGVPPGDGVALVNRRPAIDRVKQHFVLRESSQPSMLATEVRRGGKAVNQAPVLTLIRPVAATAMKATSGLTWGLKRLRVRELWDQGITGRGVLIGHLDTGVDASHPALAGAVADFAEFDWNGDRVPRAAPRDSDEHGTHTAGTIVGRKVSSTSFGVAPGAKLVSALVIEGGNVIARILGGMDWVIGAGARILSMSLGLRGYHDQFLPLMQAIRNRGILPVIAVGNEGPGTSRSPGNFDLVLSVGASDAQDDVPSFSSSQTLLKPRELLVPDLIAPGADVLSALPRGRYGSLDGTSMATPHVAGLAALLWEAEPGATVDEIEEAIFRSCKQTTAQPRDGGNRGIPDAVAALAALRSMLAPSGGGAPGATPRSATRKSPATRRKARRTSKRQKSQAKRRR